MGKAGSGELVQGTLPLLILRTLATGPNHGFAIARRIQQVSNEVLKVEEGSLYPALHRQAERLGFADLLSVADEPAEILDRFPARSSSLDAADTPRSVLMRMRNHR